VPEFRPGREISSRIEYRAPDSACNPYLTFATLLAAGLEGIEREYPLPASHDAVGEEEALLDAQTLPGSLYEALQEAEGSELLRRSLGDHVFETLLASKRLEWESYRAHITDYELDRYLAIL
jgi:glutamine synthetase